MTSVNFDSLFRGRATVFYAVEKNCNYRLPKNGPLFLRTVLQNDLIQLGPDTRHLANGNNIKIRKATAELNKKYLFAMLLQGTAFKKGCINIRIFDADNNKLLRAANHNIPSQVQDPINGYKFTQLLRVILPNDKEQNIIIKIKLVGIDKGFRVFLNSAVVRICEVEEGYSINSSAYKFFR